MAGGIWCGGCAADSGELGEEAVEAAEDQRRGVCGDEEEFLQQRMQFVWEKVAVEAEAKCGIPESGGHTKDEVWGGACAWAKEAKPASAEAKLTDEGGIMWKVWCAEEVFEEGGNDRVGGGGEWASPFLPRRVIDVCGEVVEDIRR